MAFVYLSCTLIITSSLINPSLATSDPYVDGRNGTLVAQDVFETSTLTPTDDDSDKGAVHRPFTAEEFDQAYQLDMESIPSGRLHESADLFEGDIAGIESIVDVRNAVLDLNLRWPQGVIPYVITTAFNQSERIVIARAILEFHKNTCIRFVPRTDQRDYIIFRTTGSGCNSNVGRAGGAQTISLDTGCVFINLVIHELMHCAGFFHEQCRTDRDDYVVINWSNIQEGFQRNFDKLTLNMIQYLGVPYDTGSVLHYDQFAFAKNRAIPTIYAKNGAILGNTKGFSQSDILKINRLYECDVPSSSTSTTTTEATATTTTADSSCVDLVPNCRFWSGRCNENIPFLSVACRATCRLCNQGDNCVDTNNLCSFWARLGECVKNPNYMLIYCQSSCNVCNKS